MKKITSILLIFVLCLGMVSMTGCSGSKAVANPYEGLNLSEYITLPDYNAFTTSEPTAAEITDEDVETEIQSILEDATTTEAVTEGVVEEGDTLVIDFAGTLADGTTEDGMNAEDYTLSNIGNSGFIDGFDEGLIGVAIGETVSLDLQFPDPYSVNEELSGKDVTFEVTIKSKQVEVVPELNDEFVKENSDVKTVDEYKAYIRQQLEQNDYDNKLYDLKNELYSQVVNGTEVLQYPEDKVTEEAEAVVADYESMATSYGYSDWDTFRDVYFQMDQSEFDEQVKLYAQSVIKQEMIIYALAEQEGITLTQKEYNDYLDEMLTASGFEDADAFESYAGVTLEEYAEMYKLDRDLLLTNVLDTIYDRLEKE